MDAIGRLAELVRTHKGQLSNREIANRSGGTISYQTVSNILNGKAKTVQRRTLEGLHRALEIPLQDLYEAAGMAMEPIRLPAGTEELGEAARADLVRYALNLLESQRSQSAR